MALIIDGYNLLNAAGITPREPGPATFERSRQALLNFLVWALEPDELRKTTVVFDAGPNAPRNLPRTFSHHGITVRFASRYDDADS